MLISGAIGFDLECTFEPKESRDVNFQCDVTKNLVITAAHEGATVTTVNGQSDIHAELEVLNIRRQIVHFFPQSLEKFFPKLKNLSIKKSELKAITQADLKPLSELKRLHLRFNEIGTLEADLFKFNLKLEVIDFTGNKITSVGLNLLQPLVKLHKVFFKGNICIDNAAFTPSGLQEFKAQLETQCAQ